MAEKKRRSKLESDAMRLLQPDLRTQGHKVKAARRRRRLTQKELGRQSELSQQTISQLERGRNALHRGVEAGDDGAGTAARDQDRP